jgi:hypothetical protein
MVELSNLKEIYGHTFQKLRMKIGTRKHERAANFCISDVEMLIFEKVRW